MTSEPSKTDSRLLRFFSSPRFEAGGSFRLTKSGLGIDEVYLQTPSSEKALMFVVALAAHFRSLADAVFRREGKRLDGRAMTMHGLEQRYSTVLVCLDRSQERLFVMQGRGPVYREELFRITDVLRINPQLLLGYMGD